MAADVPFPVAGMGAHASLLFGASLALSDAQSLLTAEAELFPRSGGPTRAVVHVLTYA